MEDQKRTEGVAYLNIFLKGSVGLSKYLKGKKSQTNGIKISRDANEVIEIIVKEIK